jgi:hypothetical protein
VRRAQAIMNGPGMQSIRSSLGKLAVAYPLKSNIEEIRWAMRLLRMDLPLVLNDDGLKWVPYLDHIEVRRNGGKTFWMKLKERNRTNSSRQGENAGKEAPNGSCTPPDEIERY